MANNKIIDLNALQEFLAKCDIRYQATLVSGTNIKTINNTTLLGSGNYAFDSEFSEVSTNALQNQVISKEIREINYELAVIRESLFETTLTEIDYEEQWATLYTIPETLTDNDGTHRLVYSETQLKMAKGNSVVVNQLCPTLNSTNWSSLYGSVSYSNGVATILATEQYGGIRYRNLTCIAGHKYLSLGKLDEYLTVRLRDTTASQNQFIDLGQIFTANYNFDEYRIMDKRSSDWTNQNVSGIVLVDLTQEFPINTPTSVDDVRVKWIIVQGYIPYNTGTLESTTISGVKIRWFNQWDETNANVIWNESQGGAKQNNANSIGSNDYIRVIPGSTYYLQCGKTASFYVLYYDKDKNFIGYDFKSGNNTFSIPDNCLYITWYSYNSYGTTYNHDICINVSNANLNGTYKPFVEYIISVPQTTLRSAGSVQDYLEVVDGDIVEGEQLYNVVKHVLVGSVDLGTLNWHYSEPNGGYWASSGISSLVKIGFTETTVPKSLCDKFEVIANSTLLTSPYPNGITIYRDNGNIICRNGSYTTQPSGTLYYELATTTTETIATNLHFDQVSALIEQGGTIEPIYTDVPCDLTTTFVVKKAVGE